VGEQDMGIKPDQDVIVYCFKGSRASNTLMQLRHAGFKGMFWFALGLCARFWCLTEFSLLRCLV
jgi:rhodanese-related sulfurtransferase